MYKNLYKQGWNKKFSEKTEAAQPPPWNAVEWRMPLTGAVAKRHGGKKLSCCLEPKATQGGLEGYAPPLNDRA